MRDVVANAIESAVEIRGANGGGGGGGGGGGEERQQNE